MNNVIKIAEEILEKKADLNYQQIFNSLGQKFNEYIQEGKKSFKTKGSNEPVPYDSLQPDEKINILSMFWNDVAKQLIFKDLDAQAKQQLQKERTPQKVV
jgi:hypothetical protein